jgi:hypothetical protein
MRGVMRGRLCEYVRLVVVVILSHSTGSIGPMRPPGENRRGSFVLEEGRGVEYIEGTQLARFRYPKSKRSFSLVQLQDYLISKSELQPSSKLHDTIGQKEEVISAGFRPAILSVYRVI